MVIKWLETIWIFWKVNHSTKASRIHGSHKTGFFSLSQWWAQKMFTFENCLFSSLINIYAAQQWGIRYIHIVNSTHSFVQFFLWQNPFNGEIKPITQHQTKINTLFAKCLSTYPTFRQTSCIRFTIFHFQNKKKKKAHRPKKNF